MLLNELAEKSGMTKDTLRYYEKIGLLPMVPRDHQGRRRYPVKLLEWLRFLHQMKAAGMSLKAIREYIRLLDSYPGALDEREGLLVEAREKLQEEILQLQEKVQQADGILHCYETRWEPGIFKLRQSLETEQERGKILS